MPRPPLAAMFDKGQVPTIACVNAAASPLGVDFRKLVAALQQFADKCFTPVWGVACRVIAADKIAAGNWGMTFIDDPDEADALGYHDLTPAGLPLSKVFVKLAMESDGNVSVTASHELAEMLVDPGIQLCAWNDKAKAFYAYETADACEALSFPVNGVPMTDFVYPSWFEGFRKQSSTQFDYLKKIKRPFQLLPGGYASVFKGGRWTNLFGSRVAAKTFAARHPRAARRAAGVRPAGA